MNGPAAMSATLPYPIYNSTFITHRVSPLYHGATPFLDERTLREHARRFLEAITGESVRGVQISTSSRNDILRESGPVKSCTWNLLGDEAAWRAQNRPGSDEDVDRTELTAVGIEEVAARGIHVEVNFERISYTALMLRDPQENSFNTPGFTSLPLLMVRMPSALREAFKNFVTSTFDTRITLMNLSSIFLASALEDVLSLTNQKDAQRSLGDLRLQLAFSVPGSSLRTMDIAIAPEDISRFLLRGQHLTRPGSTEPFAAALAEYMRSHLAMNIANPAVHLAKVIYGPLALSSDAKVKLFEVSAEGQEQELDPSVNGTTPASNAADHFLMALCREAATPAVSRSRAMRTSSTENSATHSQKVPRSKQSSNSSPQKGRSMESDDVALVERNTRQTTIPFEPPPPYALHDPSRSGMT